MRPLRPLVNALALLSVAVAAVAAPPASSGPPQAAPQFSCAPPEPRPTGAALVAFCRKQHLEADACAARDGIWWSYGLAPPGTQPWCHLPTPDAGHACTSNSQCRHSACDPDAGGTPPAPGKATGHCRKRFEPADACLPSVQDGVVVTPGPCPVI